MFACQRGLCIWFVCSTPIRANALGGISHHLDPQLPRPRAGDGATPVQRGPWLGSDSDRGTQYCSAAYVKQLKKNRRSGQYVGSWTSDRQRDGRELFQDRQV